MGCRWLLAAVLCAALPCAQADEAAALGEALYVGRVGMQASLRGDSFQLPPAAVICAHCHEPSAQPGREPQALAPRLDRRLAEALPRRGGPERAYDETAFCRLLRRGLDPGEILVRRTMPLFEADAQQCSALWAFLSRRNASEPSGR